MSAIKRVSAWVHWVKLNPIDEDQRLMAQDLEKLIAVAGAAEYFLEDPSQTHGWKEQLRRALAALERE